MEEKKNNNLLIIILVVLLVVAAMVIGYLLGMNVNKVNHENTNESNENIQDNINKDDESEVTSVNYTPKCNDSLIKATLMTDIDETKYNNVVDYIKEQQNVKIIVSYCDENSEKEIDGVAHFDLAEYTLTDSELNNALNELATKKHSIGNGGIGGGPCVPTVHVRYERNNNNYEIKHWGALMQSNDGNIYKIVDKTVTTPESQEYCHYFIEGLDNTINNAIKNVR